MAFYFTADTHFGDKEILERENRPFRHIEDCDDYIVKIWNRQAGRNDVIYHLGDFFTCNKYDSENWLKAIETVKKITAPVILVVGESEQYVIDKYFGKNFEKFRDFCIDHGFLDARQDVHLNLRDTKLYLNHFPANHKDDYFNLFGHLHRITGLWKPYGINVGCDLSFFRLTSEDELFRLMNEKTKHWDTDKDVIGI